MAAASGERKANPSTSRLIGHRPSPSSGGSLPARKCQELPPDPSGARADEELDLFTVLLHTTALRGNRWELAIAKPFLKAGAFHLQQIQTISGAKLLRLGRLSAVELASVAKLLRTRLGLMGSRVIGRERVKGCRLTLFRFPLPPKDLVALQRIATALTTA